MANILSTDISAIPVGGKQIQLFCTFTLDNGDVLQDGPRHFPDSIDVNATSLSIGALAISLKKSMELWATIYLLPWNYVLKYNTNVELAAYVRELYRSDSKDDLAIVAARILEWIANGRYTDAQIQNVFNLSSAQWTALKTKMQNLVNSYAVVSAAAGE
jgi:hypothetical protein